MNALIASQRTQEIGHPIGGDAYAEALAVWLQGKKPNTRRSYMRAVRAFLAYAGIHPSEARAAHIAGWKESLKAEGKSDSTIAQRLSALSAYYRYLVKNGIHPANPVDAVDRDDLDISPYGKARHLAPAAFNDILAAVDADTAAGARDYAMLLFYVLCARRRSEVARLRGRDIRRDGEKITYRVRLKGGRSVWKEMPPPVWQAIRRYLRLDGRQLQPEAPLFVARRGPATGEEPITGAAVSNALKRYAEAAGIPPESVSVHSLRHLGAILYARDSGDIEATRRFLNHSHLNTTQIYLSQLEGEGHGHWQGMMAAIGIE